MVAWVWHGPGADRTGSRAAVAMAACWHAGGGAGGRAAGNPACARRFQGDAGQDRPQGRPRHCATDATGMVPPGALQVAGRTRNADVADRTQADAVEVPRRGDEPARDPAWLRAEG